MSACLRMEVPFELREFRKTLIPTKDNIVFVVEEELGKVGVDGVLAYFSCPRGERRHGEQGCLYPPKVDRQVEIIC